MGNKTKNGSSSTLNGKTSDSSPLSMVLESRVFAMAMKVAEKLAYSKSKIFRLLQHAFEKLKEESNRNRLQQDFMEKTQILMRMMRAYSNGAYKKIPVTTIMRIAGGLIYFVWILDVIPDFIPLLGLADDLAVIVWVYNGINEEIEDFEQWESVTAVNIEE